MYKPFKFVQSTDLVFATFTRDEIETIYNALCASHLSDPDKYSESLDLAAKLTKLPVIVNGNDGLGFPLIINKPVR